MILLLLFNRQFLLEDISGEVPMMITKKIQKYGKFWLTQLIFIQANLFQMDYKLSQGLKTKKWIMQESKLDHIESMNLNGLQLLCLELKQIGGMKKYICASFKF